MAASSGMGRSAVFEPSFNELPVYRVSLNDTRVIVIFDVGMNPIGDEPI